MAERRTFREKVKNATRKSAILLKKLSPERAVSRIKLNIELVNIIDFGYDFLPESGDWERMKELVTAGANVNIKAKASITPLMFASFYGQTDLCVFLIEKGADIDAKNDKGHTAFDFAESLTKLRLNYPGDRKKTAKFLKSVKYLLNIINKEDLKSFLPNFMKCTNF